MMNFQIKGLQEVIVKIKAKPGLAKNQVKQAINWGCEKIVVDTKSIISMVGDPDGVPRKVTGNLYNSIRVGKVTEKTNEVSQTVGANPDGTEVGYSLFLEVGTSRMKPRPYLSKIVEKNRSVIINKITQFVKNIC